MNESYTQMLFQNKILCCDRIWFVSIIYVLKGIWTYSCFVHIVAYSITVSINMPSLSCSCCNAIFCGIVSLQMTLTWYFAGFVDSRFNTSNLFVAINECTNFCRATVWCFVCFSSSFWVSFGVRTLIYGRLPWFMDYLDNVYGGNSIPASFFIRLYNDAVSMVGLQYLIAQWPYGLISIGSTNVGQLRRGLAHSLVVCWAIFTRDLLNKAIYGH